MEHPARFSEPLVRDWRSTAFLATGVAALELFVLAILAFVLIVRPLMANDEPAARAAGTKPAAAQKAATPAKAKPVTAHRARSATKVLVLNGNGLSGAASDEAALLHTKGYPVVATANAPGSDFPRTLVMYRPGFRGEGERLGRDFKIARVSPLDGLRVADLQGAMVVVIVGNS
jgi:LytR cell envelope-related transcriptional attenuator